MPAAKAQAVKTPKDSHKGIGFLDFNVAPMSALHSIPRTAYETETPRYEYSRPLI
jgi:hypothetical protein